MSASDGTTARGSRLARRMVVISRRANLFRWLEIGAAVALAMMIFATWAAFSRTPDETNLLPTRQISFLLVGALVPAMALLVLWGRRRALKRAAGSTARLHVRLVFVFSLIAAVPTLLVAAFAAVLFQSGVDFWFSDSSRGLMDSANSLARGYYEQNQLDVAQETQAMAGDMLFTLRQQEGSDLSSPEFLELYDYQMQRREINESAILQALPDGKINTALAVVAKGNEPAKKLAKALPAFERGEMQVVMASPTRVEAILPIDREAGIYLYNARNTGSLSFSQWERANDVVTRYQKLTERARALQLRFNLALFFVSLALVGFAVWFALRFADRQVEPLTRLVLAARKVGAGNFALRVEGRTGADEIGLLNRAFNRMTAQLEAQTDDLVRANRELDERRAFIEAVLESMSAGIVSIDEAGTIQLMNTSARALLFDDPTQDGRGRAFAEVSPQIAGVMEQGGDRGIVTLNRGADLLTLAVRIAPATGGKVITFEDITRQLLDQRRAAWSDVARRIAHEIKNPLTPIQLATERLKRRYRNKVGDDDAVLFDELTSTIVRQVGTLRKMVDEFSSFARLPKPVFRDEDALDLVRQSVFLQEVAHQDIAFTFDTPDGEVPLSCDRHQFGQAMTNVLKNAVEAVEARKAEEGEGFSGHIAVGIEPAEDMVDIHITDNGVGLPADRDRIAEPYVTTREKGTGLGLAIVTKIVEEHGGEMSFAPAPDGGTQVVLRFARAPEPAAEELQT